ncbi:hypothetical protein NC661_20000 [Aquibacillus koreensis]|uniref:Uncharacterized protein n=1 Tax=Aquibacillus koreensis TaxID=279446 RepID=A0A9X3WPC4_9BACI|nr:hypothetical protein [Aquibacillus koreensis]MCT2536687.1 hypothetical protein [Aquibacillus koreensis]MDC3422640.1 hypothetical protein [Aquibacillus koreensis]
MSDKTFGTQDLVKPRHDITSVQYSKTVKLVYGSLLGAIAALLQAAGLFAGIGYAFSIMATGPIVLATVISIRIGLITYVLTTCLLVIIQPTEVFIFLFTTGLLGVSLGIGFKLVRQTAMVTLIGAVSLATGVLSLLYLFQFPILGPSINSELSVKVIAGVVAFSLVYSWIWMRVSMFGFKRMRRFLLGEMVKI